MKNWKTTLFGAIGGTAFTTAVAALASPEIMAMLQNMGVPPVVLVIIGGVAKIVRDVSAQDASAVQP